MSPIIRLFFPTAAAQEKRLRPLLDSMAKEFGVDLSQRAGETAKRIAIESVLGRRESAQKAGVCRKALMVL